MRSLVAVLFVLVVAVPLAIPSAADAARFRSAKKAKTSERGGSKPGVVKSGAGPRRGLTGIFRARQPGQKSAVREKLGRAVNKVRREATFERVVIRAPIAIMKFGSTMTFGAALATGRPSVIVTAGLMTAATYALGPAMKLAERLGERIALRIDQRRGS